jgi:hypothetical protein
MFEIKARVYDLQVTPDEMHQLKWGLYRGILYQAEHFKEYQGPKDTLEDFIEKTKAIEMHEWITRVLEHGYMHDHERVMIQVKEIINGDY